jgi:RNA polymerase sigma-70 factor (ECF subfamily)
MDGRPLDALLAELSSGDAVAAEKVFVAYEPYLRMVVRRQLSDGLRAKFDSIDIVQSVWADLLDHFRDAKYRFRDAEHLRAFLVRVTRNRFIDRLRQHRSQLEHERPVSSSELEGMPSGGRVSEVVLADELWDQILESCPPAHYELLRLKRQGLSLAEIADRTGLHASSVRRVLYEVARRLARKQAATGGRPSE